MRRKTMKKADQNMKVKIPILKENCKKDDIEPS